MTGAPKDPFGGAKSSAHGGDTPFGEYSGLGLQFAISVVVWVLVGQWLDKKFAMTPWLLIACLFLGGGLSFYNMYTKLMAVQKRDDAARAARRDGLS
jgi:F0F1-type ATP synthase assembly protein I